jgi:replicative DNA helicase
MSTAILHDESAERALLGAVIVRNGAMDDLADLLEPAHFGREHHRLTFAAMRDLHVAGTAIDPITLAAELERAGDLDTVGRPFLHQLGEGVARSANVAAYAKVVRDCALRRDLAAAARRMLADAGGTEISAAQLLEDAEQAIYRLSATAVKTDWVSGADLSQELFPVIETLTNERKALTGVATGFRDLDWMTRGLQAGDLVLLGARPSSGKTALALQLAMTAAKTVPVAFFSVEMSRAPLGLRIVSAAAQVDCWRLLSGGLNEFDLLRVGEGLAQLGEAAIYIDESPTLSPIQARSKLRRLKAKAGTIGLVVIDYLQLMAALPEHRTENRTTQVAGISRALKILAREFGVPFLVLSQLSRGLERSTDKRPQLSDLRESGALEQDADVVLLLHRPEMYDKDNDSLKGKAELIVAKQRNGPIGHLELFWSGPQMRFETERRAS